jgi:ABC-type multidrug transport system fused ATPase/permease subunit
MTGGWQLLRQHTRMGVRPLLALLGWTAAECVPTLLSGTFVAAAIDRGFMRGDIAAGAAWLGALAVVHGIAVLATRRVFPLLADIVEPLRDRLVRAVVAAALAHATVAADAPPDAADVARLTEQTETVRQLVAALLRTARQVALGLVASVVGVTLLAAGLVPLVAVPLVAALAVYVLSLRRLARLQRTVVLAGEQVSRQAGPVLHGVRDIVACGAEERAAAVVHRAVDAQHDGTVAASRAGLVRGFVVLLGSHVPLVLILLAAPGQVRDGRLTVGELSGAVVYLTAYLNPALQTLVQLTTGWGLQLGVVLGRLAGVVQVDPPPGHRPVTQQPTGADLTVHRLTFGYGPVAEPVLRDLDLSIYEGEHLAVVGPSGVGKSTLANLLCGLAQPQRGEVRLGGVPVTAVDRLLPDHVVLIPQQAYVFSGTLRENFTYLNPTATVADLLRAVDDLGLHALLDRAGGLDAAVGADGLELSAAERQQVALVRAYVSPARVVVLDEATSALDPVTEARVERAFARRPGTLVVIAHRMSSAFRADRVLLLDGTQALLGSDRELRAASELYADLVGYWEGTEPGPVD